MLVFQKPLCKQEEASFNYQVWQLLYNRLFVMSNTNSPSPIKDFIKHHYRHFNAASVVDASEAYISHLQSGGSMMVTLAGAMSTAELGLSLAEMIRQDKVQAISCTGANLEEDVFNLVAHDFYV